MGHSQTPQGHWEPEEALVHVQKSLEIEFKLLRREHLNIATSHQNLAVLYQSQGNQALTTEMVNKAYHIFLKKNLFVLDLRQQSCTLRHTMGAGSKFIFKLPEEVSSSASTDSEFWPGLHRP